MADFKTLWDNFPDKEKLKKTCTNKQKDSNKPFSDYCAIMLSDCLIKSGVDISLIKGNRCWSHVGKKHILLAEDLAVGLKNHIPSGFSALRKVAPGSFQDELDGKLG